MAPNTSSDAVLRALIETTYVDTGIKQAEAGISRLKVMLNSVSGVSQNFTNGFKAMGNEVLANQKNQADYWKQYYSGVQGAISVTEQGTMAMKEASKAQRNFFNPNVFQGWAMSLMFAGMAMERAARSIRTFGTKAFDEITHSVEGATTQNDMLQGSMKYLGFTIGQALDPVMGWLIPIVDKISNWVEQNPRLTRFGVILLTISGIFFTILGMATLAWVNGMKPLLMGMTLYLPNVTKLLTTLKTEAILTGAALKGMSIGGLVGLLGIIGGIILLLGYIFRLKTETGGWGELFKSVGRGILRVNALILESFIWIGAQIGKMWAIMFNGIIWTLNKIISASNSLLGTNFKKIEKMEVNYSWGDGVLRNYLDWEQKNMAPEKGYATGGGLVPTYNTPTTNNYNINIGTVNSNNADELLAQMNRYAAQLSQLQQG